jgi:membrane-associated phospholipid phosphatase
MSFRVWLIIFFFLVIYTAHAQDMPAIKTYESADTLLKDSISALQNKGVKIYTIGDGQYLGYGKPKSFGFITNFPRDMGLLFTAPFKKESLTPLAIIAGSTVLLLIADQHITDGVQHFSRHIGLNNDSRFRTGITLGGADIYQVPQNLNSAIYSLGEGLPSLAIGAGLFTYGKITHDYRSVSTAGQLVESFLIMGITTQFLKRITGRESPSVATKPGGRWQFFTNPKTYQQSVPSHDAFPSGHLATLMSTVTILSGNYPEKHWIKPVGYSVTGLVGMAMINNGVHWAGDYPLALGLGYLAAKITLKTNQIFVVKHKKELPN